MFSGRRNQSQGLHGRRRDSEDSSADAQAVDDDQRVDAELVRRRRLARFGSSTTASGLSRTTDEQQSSAERAREQGGLQENEVASTHERGPKHAEASLKPTAREVAAPSRQPAAAQAEEELVHQSLLRVLDVQTNDLAELRASAGFSTTETPTLLTSTELDALLAERLQDPRIGDALLYLIGCYHRARQELASIQAARSQKMRENLSSVLPLLVAYARTCLCEPNLFVSAHTEQASASAYDYAATWFLNQFRQQSGDSSDASHVLSQAMYIDMVHWWAHDAPDELAQVLCLFFRKLVETARAELEQVLLQKAPSPWLQSLGAALNPPEALRIFVSMEDFVAGDTRTKIRSLLGPFLTPTALHYEDERVSRALFPNPMTNANHPMEQETITAVQWSLDTLRDGIYRLLLRLLRSGAEHRERVLTWMANQLNANTERMKIQAAESETSTDGYMLNLTDVLLRLAAPFADPRSSKLQNVSSRCLYDGHRVRLLDQETRVGCDQSQIQTWQADDSASPTEQGYSFVTECFFLTARSLQLTFLPFLQHYREDIMRQIQRLEEMKQELDMALQHPHPSIQHLEQQLMRSQCERALERLYRDRQSCHIYLLDSASLDRLLHFLGALSSYMMQLAGFHGTLPLPAEDTASVPRAYALLPESLFELIAEVLQTVTQLRLPVPLTTVAALFPHFVEFATMLLSNTHYLRNVHIRARYAEWLAQMFPAVGRELRNALGTVHLPPEFEAAFLGNEQVVGNLPPALMRLYIDVERTGTHTQFFDKFAMRFYMSEVLVAMWRVPAYEQTLRQLATSREDLFVHFSNMLFNDANFLLDETLQALTEIHELERILDQGSAEGQNLTAQTREEKRQRLLQLQRQARSFNQLANSSIRLMVTLTEEVRQPFLRPELLDRLTHMLNYFLVALCGPRCENLVVRDRQRYEWEPRQLLAQILRIYLFMYDPSRDLPGTKRFGSSIAADGRSYRPEVLERAAQIAEKRGLLTPAESARFRGLADLVETCAKEQVAEEEELGEVPEEFLDPILATIMQDPVLLPSSRKIVDRSTIVRHLLSDPHDPFNRQPLKGEDVIPQPALKQQIMDWLQQRQRR